MSIPASGLLIWAAPVMGIYTVVVTATDPGGLTGRGTYAVNVVQPNRPPKVAAAQLSAVAATPFSATASATDPDGDTVTSR